MINGTLLRAARARLARLRAGTDDPPEAGFALVFVMLVTTIITIAVATTLTVTTPNIVNAKTDEDSQAAFEAAQAGIDDAVAYLISQKDCRSTSRVCDEALGANSVALHRPGLAGTDESYTWTTDSSVTSDYDVRVRATGQAGTTSRTLTADLGLAPSILSFGYYTDYESQAPSFLYQYFDPRSIYIDRASTYKQIDATTIKSPATVTWNGPPLTGKTSPYPAAMCGEHWYAEGTSSPGRFSYASNGGTPVWGENGKINGVPVTRTSSCDVVFTTGMTEDGPVYTRDAMYISDGTPGGVGPIFKQPVYTLWGYTSGDASYNTPAPTPSAPWRQDTYDGGRISASSPYKPAIAPFDIQLPTDIGTEGLPDNDCVYLGPTRVKLNGDGTATITSPETTAANPASDPNCYPGGSLAGGIVNFTLSYQHTGNGAIYVKNDLAGTDAAPATWPSTGTKATIAATPQNSVFYLTASGGGATSPDQPSTDTAPSANCSSSTTYSNAGGAICAWTNVGSASDALSSTGWSTYTTTNVNCGTAAPTNRLLFECDWSHLGSSGDPLVSQSGGNYATLRSGFQTALASGSCVTGSTTVQKTCLTSLLNTQVQTANTSSHVVNYSSPSLNDHQYLVTAAAVGSASQGAAKPIGGSPTAPMTSDPLFTSTRTPAQEAPAQTPITLTVSRQVYNCYSGGAVQSGGSMSNGVLKCQRGTPGWGGTTTQFTVTVSQSVWSIISAAGAASYFPNTADVTQYAGQHTGANGTDWPGDLYVEGDNQGKISLIADHDVVVTGNINDTSANSANDAVDIVAGNNVRNYHPVECVDQTASDITNTTPGWCPNDITGLYSGSDMENNGTLTADHPAMQYTNLTTINGREIDAAIFALSGSFMTDNYDRGLPLGNLTVNGGLYQSHRGANGEQWEYKTSDTKRPTSGYSLQYHYVDLEHSNLPYTPPVDGDANTKIWTIESVSSGGSS